MELSATQIAILFILLGSLAGFLAGLLGIGGGIILVPLFLWGFQMAGFSPEIIVHAAFGTSLAVIIPTALSSTLAHRKRGNVEWDQVFYLSIGGMLGAVTGASLAAVLPGVWLRGLFGLMLIMVALKLLASHPHLPPKQEGRGPVLPLLLVGFTGGAFSAFFGVGGGVVAVPLMVLLLRLPIHLAVGNSSALIVVSSLFGALSYALHGWGKPSLPPFSLGYVNLFVASIVAPFTIIFARKGVKVAVRVPHDKLLKVFAVLLILVGLKMVMKTLFF